MADEKVGCGTGCLIFIIICMIIGGIMTCSNKKTASSAVKDYKAGNIEKALEKFNKISDMEDMNSVHLYYYAKALEPKNSKKAKEVRELCYDKLIDKESEVRKFKKEFGDEMYNNLAEKAKFSLRRSVIKGKPLALKAAKELIKAGDVYDSFVFGENTVVAWGIQNGKRCYLTRTEVNSSWFVCKMSIDSNDEVHFEYTNHYYQKPTVEFLTNFGW